MRPCDRRAPRLGASLAPRRAEPRSRDRLLGSTSRLAVRTELPTLLVWVVAAGTFAAILGAFAKSIADQASKIHLHAFTQVTTASGYLALSFVLFTLAVSLFATSHISAIRDDGVRPPGDAVRPSHRAALVARRSACRRSRVERRPRADDRRAGLGGAASQSSGVSLGSLVEAGANCVPAALCFLGLGALLFATLPRLSGGGALALVGSHSSGSCWGPGGAPTWLLALSPFHHVAAVPQSAFDAQGELAMMSVAGLPDFCGRGVHRRDLQSGSATRCGRWCSPNLASSSYGQSTDPIAGAGEIVIEVAACGVCRTDLQILKGDIPLRKAPLILGHQIVGRIVGSGERVGLAWLWGACGRCKQCLAGLENLCEFAEFTGWTVDGGYAQRVVAREDFVYPLARRASTTSDAAPLLCAGIIGYRALRLSGITPGGAAGVVRLRLIRSPRDSGRPPLGLRGLRVLPPGQGTGAGGSARGRMGGRVRRPAARAARRGGHVRARRVGGRLGAAGDRPGRHRGDQRHPPRWRPGVLLRPAVARAYP